MSKNVFETLYKFVSYAEENYLSESLVFLLALLLERDHDIGLAIINRLCGLPQSDHFDDPQAITISTQVTVGEARPDIVVSDNVCTLVYIEVKHDSSLGAGQLECYSTKLQESGYSNTQLVLLTRSRGSLQETTLPRNEFHHVCWYEIFNWLSSIETVDQVCQYFIRDFANFLETKGMSMKRVTWEYRQGVPAMLALTNMMEISLTQCLPMAQIKRTGGWVWRGFYIDSNYFFGFRYEQAMQIVFENNFGTNPTYKRELDLEQVDFFSLTKDEQFECLVGFLQQAYDDAQKEATILPEQPVEKTDDKFR